MIKKISLSIILFISLFVFSGCKENTSNIENYYYVVAIGVDKIEENENILLSVQIASTSGGSSSDSSQSSESKIYTTEAINLSSGISVLDNYLSKKLNFSHCSAVIFSEELAKDGINSYITTLSNNSEIRPTCKIMISSTTASEALECVSNSDENFSSKLYEFIIDSANYTGYSINPQIVDFFYEMNSEFPSPVATYAKITDGILQNVGIAIFEEDKFVDNLDVLDSIAYSLITNNINICTITITDPFFPDKYIDLSISPKKDTKIDIELINGYPYIKINAYFECSINSMNDYFNYESNENIKILENAVNNYIKDLCLNFLYKISNKYNLDICNFKNYISSKYLTIDEYNKINWESIYKYSTFDVNIESSIEYSGLLSSE